MSDKEDQNQPPKSSKNTTPSVDTLRPPPNLKAIPGGKANTAPKRKKQPEVKGSNKPIHTAIVDAMLGIEHGWPAFPAKLHKVVDRAGNSVIYEEDERGIVHLISVAQVDAHIGNYWVNVLPSDDKRPIFLGDLTADDAVKVRRLWLTIATARKKPFKLLGWKDDPEPAHHKVDFDLIPVKEIDKEAPCYSELMGRTSNCFALMAWLGSLFDERSQRQQYVWMYGAGGQGKGALVRAISRRFGPTVSSEQPPSRDNRFWTAGLIDKRLVVFPDCNNASFVTSGLFKTLTGEDSVRIERKGESVYSTHLLNKYLFLSNDRPNITGQKSDLRRVIFCGVGDVPDSAIKSNYEELLDAETPVFLSYCWQVYQEISDGNPRTVYKISNDEELQEVVDAAEHEFDVFVDKYLTVVEYPPSTPNNARSFVRAGDIQELMIAFHMTNESTRAKCRKFLERKYGIVCRKIKHEGKTMKVFLNCVKSI